MNPKKTALVLIEFQNDFTTEGGALHGAVKGVMETTKMMEHAAETVKAARALGVNIVHSPIMFAKGYQEITAHPYGILKGVVDTNAFVKGEWGAAICDAMTPQDRATS